MQTLFYLVKNNLEPMLGMKKQINPEPNLLQKYKMNQRN